MPTTINYCVLLVLRKQKSLINKGNCGRIDTIMATPDLQTKAKELSAFQLNTLKRLDVIEKKMDGRFDAILKLGVDIQELQDAREVQIKLNTEFSEHKLAQIEMNILNTPTPSFFTRWFKRK